MSVSKDTERGTFYVQCRYRDWTGEPKKKTKRGFKTEKEARQWEYEFLKRMEGAPTMLFSEFYEVYAEDTKMRLRRTTRETKANMIEGKILPFLGHKRVNEITALDILNWENELMAMRTSNGLEYSQTYLHSICNQLSAMLNHAVRYYGLESNPMAKVGKIGSKQADEMSFWTKDEYLRFSREIMDSHSRSSPSSCSTGAGFAWARCSRSRQPISTSRASASPLPRATSACMARMSSLRRRRRNR